MAPRNLSTLHRATAERLGPRVALRYKRDGLYHDLSWFDYRRRADAAAAALIERGVKLGDRVAILAENSVNWLTADLAILATGAADVPIHAPSSSAQVEYQIRHSGATVAIVSNRDQAEKILCAVDRLPDLRLLVTFQPFESDSRLETLTWEGLIRFGTHQGGFGAGLVGKREAAIERDDLATIIYTSGTTGNPKGVMLSHGNLLSNAEAVQQNDPLRPDDVLLNWLPLSHIYARTVDHYLTILAGVTVCLADSPESLILNLAETQPTWLTAVPRFYEKVWASVEALPLAKRSAALHAIFGPRLRQLTSGGAALPRHLAEGFAEAGLPLFQGYGLTETSPVISFNSIGRHRAGTVGPAIPGVEIKTAVDGEILTRGPHVMLGYWKDANASAAAIVDGWLHTGDVGQIDADGFLTITDRKKDLFVTSGGKNVAPGILEGLLVAQPLIDQAVVFGDGRQFVSALLVPNLDALKTALGTNHGPIQINEELIDDPEALALLKAQVDAAMESLSQPERVRAFLALARPFSMEANEVTTTLKVRRAHVLARYRDRLETLYVDRSGIEDNS